MKRNVHVRTQADRELDEYVQYIAGDNIAAAMRLYDAARAAFEALAEYPGIGREFPCDVPRLSGLRKWNVKGFPSVLIFYLVFDDCIEIVRVIHGARDLPQRLRETD